MDEFPDSVHVHDVGLGGADDAVVWRFAKAHGFAIASKDSDFAERSVLEGHPPKVIWMRLGNCLPRRLRGFFARPSRQFARSLRRVRRLACCWDEMFAPLLLDL